MADATIEDMPYYVTAIKQVPQGLEAKVRIGTAGPPGASLHTTVTLSPLDPEWLKLKNDLEELYARRAAQKIEQMRRWAGEHHAH